MSMLKFLTQKRPSTSERQDTENVARLVQHAEDTVALRLPPPSCHFHLSGKSCRDQKKRKMKNDASWLKWSDAKKHKLADAVIDKKLNHKALQVIFILWLRLVD